MLSSAHMRSDVRQHVKQCTSTSVSIYEHTRSDVQYNTSTRKPTVAVQKIHTWCTRVHKYNVSHVLPASQARKWHTRKSGLVWHTRERQVVL